MSAQLSANAHFNMLAGRSRALSGALFWGGVMLLIMGLWVGNKHEGISGLIVIGFIALAMAGVALAIWNFVRTSQQIQSGTDDPEPFAKTQKLFGVVLLVVGALLLAIALLFAIWYKLAAFGEAFGL